MELMLRWVLKVVFWGVWWGNLGRFSRLQCREFWKRWSAGFCCGYRWMEGDSGTNWRVEWRTVMLGFWWSLGDEMEVISWVERALVSVERKRRKS